MSKRDTNLLIQDILDSCRKILEYTEGMTFAQFASDGKTLDAVSHNFAVIGEAAGQLPENFRNTRNEIDWNRIKGLRNRLIHNYAGTDYSILWQIKEKEIPALIEKLEPLITT